MSSTTPRLRMSSGANGSSRKLKIILGLSCLALVVIAALCLQPAKSPLPTYQGRTVVDWFYGTYHPGGLRETVHEAQQAFRAMGTNGVPFLIQNLHRRESRLDEWYEEIYPALPSWYRRSIKPPLATSYIKSISLNHLMWLRDFLAPFDDDLIQTLPILERADERLCLFMVMRPRLMDLTLEKRRSFLFSGLKDPDLGVQVIAAASLTETDLPITNALPILLQAITNQSSVMNSTPSRFRARIAEEEKARQVMAYEALEKALPDLAAKYPRP